MKNYQKGLTLIEILMAIIVLSLGLVGILSLFPTGIYSTNESVEERMSAFVGSSVKEALSMAMGLSTPEDTINGKPAKVNFQHDGLEEGSPGYEFTLPLPEDPPPAETRYFCFTPESTLPEGTPLTPEEEKDFVPDKVFSLATDTYIKSRYEDVTKGYDPTDPYQQWGYIFIVNRVDDNRPSSETGADFKPKAVYDFKINIYRVPVPPQDGYIFEEPKPRLVNSFIIRLGGQ